MIDMFDFIKRTEYDELVVAIKAAFEEIRNDNKLNQEKIETQFKNLDNKNYDVELEQKVIRMQRQLAETKQILLQLSAIVERMAREKKVPEVTMKPYEEMQTEKVDIIEKKPVVALGVDPTYVKGYLENGMPELNINEIPLTVNPEQDIINKSIDDIRNKEQIAQKRKKYQEVYPMVNEDSARCMNCKKWLKIEDPVVGETRTGNKMTEGRCPICKQYVVRII